MRSVAPEGHPGEWKGTMWVQSLGMHPGGARLQLRDRGSMVPRGLGGRDMGFKLPGWE